MNKTEFIEKLKGIKSVTSVTGKRYSLISVKSDRINFLREHKKNPETISLSELFELYSNESSITTTIAKLYISGRVQSPAVAILNILKKNSLSESISISRRNDSN